ncbi:MAG: hypothetical protein J2P36_14955, partial [Ktedonobacteraceae bacterium]|nr:hypothetical protein [Ktedonobacteraceae bacterium]
LGQFVQQKLLFPTPQELVPPSNGRKIRLPDPAERLRLENFELLDLLSRMELAWDKHPTPMEQLPALVDFVNWTMDALTETCRAKGIELDPNTLLSLMYNERLTNMGNYAFRVEQNHIDVEDFSALCRNVMGGDIQNASAFYDEATMVLQRLLCCVFEMINSRVANPRERLENQEVWEAMFEQFSLQRNEA